MGIARCNRCDKMVDLDWNVENIIVVDDKEVCTDCATDDEIDTWEKRYDK